MFEVIYSFPEEGDTEQTAVAVFKQQPGDEDRMHKRCGKIYQYSRVFVFVEQQRNHTEMQYIYI